MSDYIFQSEDLVTLILQNLHPKSLLRFRAVCKSWKHIIDSNSFLLRHLSLQTPLLLSQNTSLKFIFFHPKTFPFFKSPTIEFTFTSSNYSHHLAVVGTAHGVICLFDDDSLLLLWNPSIRRLLRLPRPHVRPTPVESFSEILPDYHSSGFWMDPSTAHFKVVVFFYMYNKIALFSSRNQMWTEVIIESRRFNGVFSTGAGDPMILVGGFVGYWQMIMIPGPCVVSSFDFERDEFGTIEFPKLEEVRSVKYCNGLIKWRDCLAIVHYQLESPGDCDLWVMKNGLWSKMFSFSLVQGSTRVVHVAEDYGMVLAECENGILVLHDPKDGRQLMKLKHKLSGYLIWDYDFVESLLFPPAPIKFL